jgi:hypothetical protein
MDLTIKRLAENDYENILVGWWNDWKWTPPMKDFLPENGVGGLIVYDDTTPVCAGFVYVSNSKVAWVDWIISNKNYTDREGRKLAIKLLLASLTNACKSSGSKYVYALIKHPRLMKTYEELGFSKGDSYTSEMIKVI